MRSLTLYKYILLMSLTALLCDAAVGACGLCGSWPSCCLSNSDPGALFGPFCTLFISKFVPFLIPELNCAPIAFMALWPSLLAFASFALLLLLIYYSFVFDLWSPVLLGLVSAFASKAPPFALSFVRSLFLLNDIIFI